MSTFWNEYSNAARHARAMATKLGVDMAIKKTREFGRTGFVVRMADAHDRVTTEIIYPGEPQS